MMHILIGILQHNKYGITKRCIDKIIENTNDVSYDIFLIDNGSMDGSANSIKKIYNEIDNIKIVLNEKNSGVIGGRNLIFNHFLSFVVFSVDSMRSNCFVRLPNSLCTTATLVNSSSILLFIDI